MTDLKMHRFWASFWETTMLLNQGFPGKLENPMFFLGWNRWACPWHFTRLLKGGIRQGINVRWLSSLCLGLSTVSLIKWSWKSNSESTSLCLIVHVPDVCCWNPSFTTPFPSCDQPVKLRVILPFCSSNIHIYIYRYSIFKSFGF